MNSIQKPLSINKKYLLFQLGKVFITLFLSERLLKKKKLVKLQHRICHETAVRRKTERSCVDFSEYLNFNKVCTSMY